MFKKIFWITAILVSLAVVFVSCDEEGEKNTPVISGKDCIVTFDRGEGSFWTITDNQQLFMVTVKEKTPVGASKMPPNPTKDGFEFKGWKDESNAPFTAATVVTADITVNAVWEKEEDPGNPDLKGTASITSNGAGNEAYRIGKELTAVTAAITFDPHAPEDGNFTYQWKADDSDISGADKAVFTITGNEAGKTIICVIGHTKANGIVTAAGGKVPFEINLDVSINVDGAHAPEAGDTVAAAPEFAHVGTQISLNYTLNTALRVNNQVVFSGVAGIDGNPKTAAAGTVQFALTQGIADLAIAGEIGIYVVFNHSNNDIETIGFPNNNATVTKTYGDTPFSNLISTVGSVTSARPVIYSSAHPEIASVNSSTGEVTIHKAGNTEITGIKEANPSFDKSEAAYNLHINGKQLTVTGTDVVKTKMHDGNTAATVTSAGALAGVVSGDTVGVTAVAAYDNANIGTGKTITVVFTLTGSQAVIANYIKPENIIYNDGVIQGAGAVVAPVTTVTARTINSLTVSPVIASTGQTVEYAISQSAAPVPAAGWQETLAFSSLTADTAYYVFARAKANATHILGEASTSAAFRTKAAINTAEKIVVDFDTDAIGKTYAFTQGGTAPVVTLVADTVYINEKSIQIASSGYNQAVIIPLMLHNARTLQDYLSLSFKYKTLSGTELSDKKILAYANNTGTFAQYAFGNSAENSNNFATSIIGETAEIENMGGNNLNLWRDSLITIDNPGTASRNLQGTIYVAIGLNHNDITYQLDDITFTLKADSGITLSPATAEFDRNTASADYKDIAVTINNFTGTLIGIQNGAANLVSDTNYTAASNVVTLKKEYLATLSRTTHNLTFVFNTGWIRLFAITVIDTGNVYTTLIDFEADTLNSANAYLPLTGGAPMVIPNPNQTAANDSAQSLRITTTNYHHGAAIPVILQHQLRKYKSINGQFNLNSGGSLTYKSLVLVAAKNSGALQTGAVLETNVIGTLNNYIGDASDVTAKTGAWTNFSITIPDVAPGSVWGDLNNECFISIGINHNNIIYLLDNIELIYETLPVWVWPSRTEFDKNTANANYADINFTIEMNDSIVTLSELRAGTVVINASNYTINNNVLTLKKEYLATLAASSSSPINFVFSDSTTKTINLNIRDTGGVQIPATVTIPLNTGVNAYGGALSAQAADTVTYTSSANYGNAFIRITINTTTQFGAGVTLGDFSRITCTYAGISGDISSKNLLIAATNSADAITGYVADNWWTDTYKISVAAGPAVTGTANTNINITIDKTKTAVCSATGTIYLYFKIHGNSDTAWKISNLVIHRD